VSRSRLFQRRNRIYWPARLVSRLRSTAKDAVVRGAVRAKPLPGQPSALLRKRLNIAVSSDRTRAREAAAPVSDGGHCRAPFPAR
jgi:hypothetical protein